MLSQFMRWNYKHDMTTTKPHRCQAAFTLIQLLVTVAILAVLTTLAAPSFIATVANSRLTSQVTSWWQTSLMRETRPPLAALG